MKFDIHILPPDDFQSCPQAATSTDSPTLNATATASFARTSSSPSLQHTTLNGTRVPFKVLAMPADPDSTFAELSRKIESRIRERYAHEEWARMPLDTLRDANGGDIFLDDKICSLYRADAPSHELQLHMYLKAVDSWGNSPRNANKRRRSEEVEAAEPSTNSSKSRKTTSISNAFDRLQGSQSSGERKQRAHFNKTLWTEEEDRILVQGVKAGLTSRKILCMLPRPSIRSASGLRSRKAKLGIDPSGNVVSASQTSMNPQSSASSNPAPKDSKTQAATLSPSSSSRKGQNLASPSPVRKQTLQSNPEVVPTAGTWTEQPNVTVSPPKSGRTLGGRTDVQRWKEAKERAGGNRTQARRYFAEGINREAMLDAVMRQDTEEIDRLKAQRRRMEREQAAEDGRPSPKRSAPFDGLATTPNDTVESYDEEVIREDDWSTDSEAARHQAAGSDEDEFDLGDEAGDEVSENLSEQDSSAVPDHDFGSSRIAELEDSPPPQIPDSEEALAAASTLPEHRRVSDHPISRQPRVKVAAESAAAPSEAATEMWNESRVPQHRSTRRQAKIARKDDVRMPPPSAPAASQNSSTNGEISLAPPNSSTKPRIAIPVIQTEVHGRLTAQEKLNRDMMELKKKEKLYLADDDDEMSSSPSSDSDHD